MRDGATYRGGGKPWFPPPAVKLRPEPPATLNRSKKLPRVVSYERARAVAKINQADPQHENVR